MSDYHLELTVRNGPLKALMQENGYKNAAELSRATGMTQTVLGEILNLKHPLYRPNGKNNTALRVWFQAKKLADFFGVSPEAIYPEEHYLDPLEQNRFEALVPFEQMQRLASSVESDPARLLEYMEGHMSFNEMLDGLGGRAQKVLKARYVDGKTLEETGQLLGVSRERIRQIEVKALRHLRHKNNKNGGRLREQLALLQQET